MYKHTYILGVSFFLAFTWSYTMQQNRSPFAEYLQTLRAHKIHEEAFATLLKRITNDPEVLADWAALKLQNLYRMGEPMPADGSS